MGTVSETNLINFCIQTFAYELFHKKHCVLCLRTFFRLPLLVTLAKDELVEPVLFIAVRIYMQTCALECGENKTPAPSSTYRYSFCKSDNSWTYGSCKISALMSPKVRSPCQVIAESRVSRSEVVPCAQFCNGKGTRGGQETTDSNPSRIRHKSCDSASIT